MRTNTHLFLVKFHEDIATAHKKINGFFRFNMAEILGQFRSGIETPALLLESHSSEIDENQNKTVHFNNKAISFMLLDFTGKADNYRKQEEVLDELENVGLDILTYLKKSTNDRNSFLFGKFDAATFRMEKVGPIFDNMYGWNILYQLKNHEPLTYEPDKWDWENV